MFKTPMCGCVYSLNGKQKINSAPWCGNFSSSRVDESQSFSFSIKGCEWRSNWPLVYPVKNLGILILVCNSIQKLVSQSKIVKEYLHIILLCLSRKVGSLTNKPKNTLKLESKSNHYEYSQKILGINNQRSEWWTTKICTQNF